MAESKRAKNATRPTQKPTYKVLVDDNYHYQDEDERYALGDFDTWDAALAAAKKVVDDYLKEHHGPGNVAAQLYDGYTMFGEDPFIVGDPPSGEAPFSAWDYAKKRCEELCGEKIAKKKK